MRTPRAIGEWSLRGSGPWGFCAFLVAGGLLAFGDGAATAIGACALAASVPAAGWLNGLRSMGRRGLDAKGAALSRPVAVPAGICAASGLAAIACGMAGSDPWAAACSVSCAASAVFAANGWERARARLAALDELDGWIESDAAVSRRVDAAREEAGGLGKEALPGREARRRRM